MGAFATSVKNGWLDDVTNSTLYLALFVGDPSGAGVEISGGNYARKTVATTDWAAAASGSLSNSSAVTFDQATDIWSADDVTYWALYDASTGGNLVAYDDVPAAQQQPIVSGNTVEFSAGDIVLTISDPS
jgi:hypothetical protein